jgi:hypothetical protein
MNIDPLFPFPGEPGSASIDLSKATKLKDVVFRLVSWSVEWITIPLQTITPEHQDLRQITIHVLYRLTTDANAVRTIGEWTDLDLLLVKLWESRSIRPRVEGVAEQDMRSCVERLLPEITRRGIVDLVERTLAV